MKKAYITRYSAVGDHIHCSHIPRLLKEREGFDYVCFEYNNKGTIVHRNNPFIDEHIVFEPSLPGIAEKPMSYISKRYEQIMKRRGFDKHINLLNSLERGYIAMEDQNEYYASSQYRREKFGKLNYYDQTTVFAGYPQHIGMKGEIFFTEEEHAAVNRIYSERYMDQFVVVCNLSGTSKHKLFYGAENVIKAFLANHPESVCITMGDDEAKKYLKFDGERIIDRSGACDDLKGKSYAWEGHVENTGRYPFRQSMLVAGKSNLVIGCESGLMVAATLLGAPTVQLMTAASIKNHGGDFENDYSLQSPATCSPCHKGPYGYIGCPRIQYLGEWYPACIKFDIQTVLNRMEEVYMNWSKKREHVSSA